MTDFFNSVYFLYACCGVVGLLILIAILRANNVWNSRGITPREPGITSSTYTVISSGFDWLGSSTKKLGNKKFLKFVGATALVALLLGYGFGPAFTWHALPPMSEWTSEPHPHEIGLWMGDHPVVFVFMVGSILGILAFLPSITGWEKKGEKLTKVVYWVAGAMVVLGLWVYFTSPSTSIDPRSSKVMASNVSSPAQWWSIQMTDANGDSIILPYYYGDGKIESSRPEVHCNGCELVCVYVNPKKAPDVVLEDTTALCPNNGITVDHVVARDITGKPGNEAKYAYVPM